MYVNHRDKLRRAPLIEAANIGSLEIIKLLIDNDADPNMEDKEHHCALSYCLDFIDGEESKYMECAIYLIENGANPNYHGKYTQKSILHCAAIYENTEFIKQLFEEYCFSTYFLRNARDCEEETVMYYAMQYGNDDIFMYLKNKSITVPRIECPCTIL